MSCQINVCDINAHNYYWFEINSLLYHERFITARDGVCLTLTPLDHEMQVVQSNGHHLRRHMLQVTAVLWCECNDIDVINITLNFNPLLLYEAVFELAALSLYMSISFFFLYFELRQTVDTKLEWHCCSRIYVPILTCAHERMRSRIQAAEMSFLRRVSGLSLREGEDVWRELTVEPLLLHWSG